MKTQQPDRTQGLSRYSPFLRLGVAAVFAVSAAFAQETAPIPEAGETEQAGDEVVELSPFVIEAGSETGWVATETLAGSRLKSSFKDIAAPIEVLTMDFMDDYGLNNIEQAAKYTINVESGDDITLGNGLPGVGGTVRIRGLASPTNSREFFGSLVPSDNYNLDRLTIASGPNSILFGTGSPAGVIDSSVRRPLMNTEGAVGLQVDSFGGFRGTIDYNLEVVEDVLAIRAIGLYNQKEWDTDQGSERDMRINVGATWQPFKHTTLFANYEYIDLDSQRPSTLWPRDKISTWYESPLVGYGGGYPAQYIFPNDTAWIEGDDDTAQRYLPPAPADGQWAIPGENNQLFQTADNTLVVIDGNNASTAVWGWQNSVEIRDPEEWTHVPSINQEADGWTLLNDNYYPVDVNTLAEVYQRETDWDILNLNFSQRIIEDLYFDAAYQLQKENSLFSEKMNYIEAQTPKIDANKFMPDGVTPNPNRGRIYYQGYPSYQKGEQEQEDWRAALSYEFDFNEKFDSWARWLGRHRAAALFSGFASEQKAQTYRYHLQPQEENGLLRDPYFPGLDYAVDTLHEGINSTPLISTQYQTTTTDGISSIRFNDAGQPIVQNNSSWLDSGTRRPQTRYYLRNGELIPDHTIPIGQPWTLTDGNGEQWTMNPESWYVEDGIRWVNRDGFSPQGKDKQDTQQFTYQGYFWENRIVLTYGYRKDKIKHASLDYINDRQSGMQQNFFDVDWNDYGDSDEGTTETKGIVAYPFRGWFNPLGIDIGGFYNESDTYQPSTSNYSPYGATYPGALGDGQDYGIIITALEGKLNARLNWYENTSGPQRAGNVPFNRFRFNFNGPFNRMTGLAPSMESNANWPKNAEGTSERVYNELGAGDPYWVVSNRAAEGTELQLNWKATPNLDLRFTWNSQEVVESDIGLDWWDFLDQIEPIADATGFPEGGETDPSDRNGDGVVTQDVTWRQAPRNNGDWSNFVPGTDNQSYQTAYEWYEDVVINGPNGRGIITALDGKSNEFVRQNRWNFNANYRFTEGKLKGFDAGGAVRWRAAPLMGYGMKTLNGADIVDLDNPIYSDDSLFFDLRFGYRGQMSLWGDRNYRINLNVRNVLNETGPETAMMDANGLPIRYRRIDGRQFILQVDFEL